MQMKFTKELPVWLAPGIKPPESLTSDGWKASQKPPADYFNWFFSRTHGALKELQDSATHIEDFNAHKSNISNPHAVTATQVGLGNVLNQKQATKSEFDAHDQDNIRHITDVERNSWNGKAEKNHTQPWSTITGIPDSTITKKGIVKLTDSVTSTDIMTAATPNSVKQVNDNANAAMASASSVNDNLTRHKIDYKNPHKVTSAQVGSYSKTETDDLFINKSEAENGLLVRKNIEITDLNNAIEPGVYSIPATGVENKPLPNSGSLIVNKDQGGIRQQFQTERTIFIRQFGGIPSNWTDWKEVAFITNVVNLTEPQSIAGTKNFIERPLVGGIEVATVDQLENEVILNTRPIGLTDGVVALLDSIENYEALRIEYSYQSNSSSAQKIHLKSQSLTFRFSAINIYDDPASKGYDLLESLVDINKNQVKFNYSKVVAYTGAITEEKNWARIDCIIGIRRAPKLYKK
ncbi:pyocin knob domain-containing protein [Enterococcus faecalis]|uniref:pyocin knob domain-containing protein n=1 Tax=Enterococcus faecalis TaxID=1351 RepID=UPI000DEBCC8A|nr:pyocin knob domain-containing protein [Enterococcus faecalis]MBW4177635.1 tail fiber protein [Enterococcus faecalis]HDP1307855.1 tail fiber protein [Enterococcus faecalis]HDT8124027.1 tail fiber protein [Enterococcus faecalis]